MSKCFNLKILLFLFVLSISIKVSSQVLRIDFERINREGKTKRTSGEYTDFLKEESSNLANKYGKLSKEYIYLKGYYLDEYNRIYQPYQNMYLPQIQEYREGREELLELTGKVYGDTSVIYANTILSYTMINSFGNGVSIDNDQFNTFLQLINKSITIFSNNSSLIEKDRYIYLSLSYSQLGDLFKKFNQRDSALKYYDIVLKNWEAHPFYDTFYTSFINKYAYLIANKNVQSAIDFLLLYEPIINQQYKSKSRAIYYFYCTFLDMYLSQNYVQGSVMRILSIADSICKIEFGEVSNEYVYFTLNYKIAAFKKKGLKSQIPYGLTYLNTNVFEKDKTLFNEKNFINYNLEWYYYYQSINESENGIIYLKWIEINDNDTILNRNTFSSKITVYRELATYYRFKNFDSCIHYHIKVMKLEVKAKEQWGDYVIHQFLEVAKLEESLDDTSAFKLGYKYCKLAMEEFASAYGKQSSAYKAAQFTMGQLLVKNSNGKFGYEYLHPNVYAALSNEKFVPPLETSVFQSYANILNYANKPDSADFFYSQIYWRNNSAQFYRILGSPQDLQLKFLDDIYNQNYFILTEHLKRYKNYKWVSKELAEYLFKKNLVFQIQFHTNDAVEDVRINDNKSITSFLNYKLLYDSVLATGITNVQFIDSVYYNFEIQKNWLLQKYVSKYSKEEGKLSNLKHIYSYSDIQEKLKPNECFIDIVRFLKNDKEYGFSPYPFYAFIIIDKNSTDKLEYFFLEDGETLEKLVQDGKNNQEKISPLLSSFIAKLKKYNKLYICPDGAFNLINFYALKDANDNFLINSKTIEYVGTQDEILQSTTASNKSQTASFFGNPIFTFSNSSNVNSERSSIFSNSSFHNLKGLPYTKIEIETASDALASKGWKTKKHIGKECSELLIKSEAATNILHIATHGYYVSENDTTTSYAMQQNPYLRSGLILGDVISDKKTLNDNVLTAYEVMNIDLKNTSLVVLSACESAKGELKPGQGVYGLQKAFKIAGAKNVLVSVNKVDDKATQLLMQYFYTNVANGDSYSLALKNAQIKMMQHPLYHNPKYWSSFILIGQ